MSGPSAEEEELNSRVIEQMYEDTCLQRFRKTNNERCGCLLVPNHVLHLQCYLHRFMECGPPPQTWPTTLSPGFEYTMQDTLLDTRARRALFSASLHDSVEALLLLSDTSPAGAMQQLVPLLTRDLQNLGAAMSRCKTNSERHSTMSSLWKRERVRWNCDYRRLSMLILALTCGLYPELLGPGHSLYPELL